MLRPGREPTSLKRTDFLETLAKGLAVIQFFSKETPSLETQEVADRMGASRATARRFLMTLESLGYLAREGRAFRLTPEVMKLGFSYFASQDLPSIARPIMNDLAEHIDETCNLVILHKGEIIYLSVAFPLGAFVKGLSTGTIMPAYPTAAGRILLAGLTSEELDSYLQNTSLKKYTPFTMVDKKSLAKIVNRDGANGFSVARDELLYGAAGLAVPIHDENDRTVAALSLSMQHGSSTDSMVHNYLPILKEAGEEISRILRASREA